MPVPSLSDQSVDSLAEALARAGHNPANALKVLKHYWAADGDVDIDQLPIARAAQGFIRGHFTLRTSRIIHKHTSADGTIKLLIDLNPDQSQIAIQKSQIESVLMPSHRADRAAVCISSQIGCAMGCDFCASTRNGLERNLTTGEIVEQFLHLRAEARAAGRRIASLVFMGMGEPMHNLDHVIPAIRLLAEPGLGALGNRAITVSTVGIVPGIDRLADESLGVNLALSLHAPDDETRSRLIPSNRRWPVDEIMAAARRFQNRHRRPVSIEYCMLAGVNDSDGQAELLAELMRDFRAHVNLIPYNSIGTGISGAVYGRPDQQRILRFLEILESRSVVTHIRQTRGDDVAAACGQLAGSRA